MGRISSEISSRKEEKIMNENLKNIPEELRLIPHWITWKNMDGKKIPGMKINDPGTWLPFDGVAKLSEINEGGGIGFVFDDSNNIGGIDLDACLLDGKLTNWAQSVVDAFDSYTEISPSGTGVKIWASGAPPKISPNVLNMGGDKIKGKTPQMEVYTTGRYFAVTGNIFPGMEGKGVRNAPSEWLKLVNLLGSRGGAGASKEQVPDASIKNDANRNNTLASLAGSMRKRGMDFDSILVALRTENVKRFTSPLPEKEIISIAKSVCRYDPSGDDFLPDKHGNILPNKQENVRLALSKLKKSLRYNTFADKVLIKTDEETETILDDATLNDLWFEIDSTFHFRPAMEFFSKFIPSLARKNPFHPVQDYLNSLKWDGVKRIDNWLTTYANAADNEYTRAVGKLVLTAAVRRIRRPGVKFDEMLILESSQGKDKSSFLATLAVNKDWFTDDLPLTSDSKEVIERTSGKWIVEASDLSGMKQSEAEELKAFLSRGSEIARLAYDKLTTERPRHFIVIGTTNAQYYLKDTTGNRRFWPVKVETFNMEKTREDRDQLWAEAAELEATGVSIRLDPSLYKLAEIQQERRRVDDPWEHVIADVLGDVVGKMQTEEAWAIIQVPIERRSQWDNQRLGEVMRRLGFERKQASVNGRTRWMYLRGTKEERSLNLIKIDFDHEAGRSVAIQVTAPPAGGQPHTPHSSDSSPSQG